jgi:5-methyltetrahydrofolate--homocysteine methyltransferase
MDIDRLLYDIEASVLDGDAERVAELVPTALEQGITAKSLVNEALLTGMAKMGRLFRDNEVYVPDVILAADAMQTGLRILKPILIKSHFSLGRKIVIGTVEHDLHDLGKTLVSSSLTAAGLDVIDLGVDVCADRFIQVLEKERPEVLALSCTLSYTLDDLKKVVEEVRACPQGRDVKIIVGGLAVTPNIAANIGADAYALNAEQVVMVVMKLLSEPV